MSKKIIYKGFLTLEQLSKFLDLFFEITSCTTSVISIKKLISHGLCDPDKAIDVSFMGVYSKEELSNHPLGASPSYTVEPYEECKGKNVLVLITDECPSQVITSSFHDGLLYHHGWDKIFKLEK